MSESKWLAVVMAWRKGELEVNETVASAAASVKGDASIYPVEDKMGEGPGRTRHRGILAAGDAEVIVVVDPHMRFDGDVLARMARHVRGNGGLLCAKCFHNPECSFEHSHPSGASWYAGAEIVFRARFADGQQYGLCWKWSPDLAPGPRGCVGGACYAFRRDWYFAVGQPLAALPGWGCDEEALSISAWYSGYSPVVFDGRVAHRWRARPPWKLTRLESVNIWKSRQALALAVVQDDNESLRALTEWNMSWHSPREREQAQLSATELTPLTNWRNSLLAMPRGWKDWKERVCKPDVIEGETGMKKKECPRNTRKDAEKEEKKECPRNTPHQSEAHGAGRARKDAEKEEKKEPAAAPVNGNGHIRANYGANENRRICQKCGSVDSRVDRTKQTGRLIVRYRTCGACGAHRATQEVVAA